MEPDGWISIHSVDNHVVGPEAASHGFGPFPTLAELEAFEAAKGDRCVTTVMPLYSATPTSAAMGDLLVLGALAYNWLGTSHADLVGHDHHCSQSGLAPGDLDLCSCGWGTFYGKFLEMSRKQAEAVTS